jgi:hypothetical protein
MCDETIRELRRQIKNLELKRVFEVFSQQERIWEDAEAHDLFQEILEKADDLLALLDLAAILQTRDDVQAEFKVALLLYVRGRVQELLVVNQQRQSDDASLRLNQDDPEEAQGDLEDEVLAEEETDESDSDLEFPTHSVVSSRQRAYASDSRDWREAGVLSLSGYRVGRTQGLREEPRRRILNWLVMRDDLRDVDDRDYAAEWGQPGTSGRLQKIVNSIAAFARDRANDTRDYSVAISHWREDLAYLYERFYQARGHAWRWPDE